MINTVTKLMSYSVKHIVNQYVATFYQNVSLGRGRWDAEIARRKVYNLLAGLGVSDDYSDTITWKDGGALISTDKEHGLIDQYIRLDIHKTTGIGYTEYKQMTVKEKLLVLDYINYKTAIASAQATTMESEQSEGGMGNDSLFDI